VKVLVCGSRDWTDPEPIRARLQRIIELWPWDLDEPTVIHGDARGADTLAAGIALDLGFWVEAFPADWQTHGRRAGYLRNLLMLDQAPDLVLAFQRNGSRGTQHTIDQARKRGIPVEVYTA
jgi:hypothetical protein